MCRARTALTEARQWPPPDWTCGIDLGYEAIPDARTLLKFRHLLEKRNLNEQLFAEIGRILQGSGMTLKTGTIVDATLIAAPSSTKNIGKKRDSEMHQTRKGQ